MSFSMIAQTALITLTVACLVVVITALVALHRDGPSERTQFICAHLASRRLREYFGFTGKWSNIYNSICYAAMVGFHLWYALAASLIGSLILIALSMHTQRYFRNNDLSILN